MSELADRPLRVSDELIVIHWWRLFRWFANLRLVPRLREHAAQPLMRLYRITFYDGLTRIGKILLVCSLLIFLFSYRVPRSDFDRDNLLTNIAGVLAILVALVPTGLDSCESCGLAPNAHHADVFKNSVHLGSAFLFFVIMAIMSYFFFTKGISKEEERLTDRTKLPLAKQRKISRNRVYRICGIIMGVLLLVLIIWFLLVKAEVVAKKDANNVVFWIETGLLLAFGFSWLVKGKALQFTGLAMFTDPNKPKT